jgi:hypothetical protein
MLRPKKQGGMGLKIMRLFNQVLLARQTWRLIQFPDSLCAQLYGAKYYPNANLIDIVFTCNASSTWHAIEYGLELLKTWVFWQIGNGANAWIWRDPWIPRDWLMNPASLERHCHLGMKLLNPDVSWNKQLLHQHFLLMDIEAILKIMVDPQHCVTL